MRARAKLYLGSASLALAVSAADRAAAQDAAGTSRQTIATAPAQAEPTAALDDSQKDIVVTAQKRSERLLDVPMSITATSGATLTQVRITSTGDLQQVSPGLVTVNNGFAFTPAIRGISSSGTSPGDENNVSLYLDDVYLGASLAGLFDLKDIERVEVLKGPQGTLFGRNATGGAIRIVTRAPSFTPGVDVSADYGLDFRQITLGGYATGPISDTVAASLNLFYNNGGNYIRGVGPDLGKRYGADKSFTARGKLLFKPTSDFSVTLAADYSNRADATVFLASPRGGRNVNQTNPAYVAAGDYEYAGSTQPGSRTISYGASADATWTPGKYLTVRSITAYRAAEGTYQFDSDRSSVSVSSSLLQQRQYTISQELNLSGPSSDRLTWIAGLYYYHSIARNPFFQSYAGDVPTGTVIANFRTRVGTESYAGFGEATWNVSDRLHLTGGGRYNYETKAFTFNDIVRAAGLRSANASQSWSSATYRAVARFDLARNWNVYASASDGFKSGVYNAYALPAIPVQPEQIEALEIGTKGRIAGITLTAAAFRYLYNNIQVQGQTVNNGVFVVTLNNAAKAVIKGFEASASGDLGKNFSFDLGLSALPTANYREFNKAQVFIPNPATGGTTNTVPYDASGSRIIRSPKWQANARLVYHDMLANGKVLVSVNYAYNDGFFWQPGNFSPEGAYSVVNARASWTDPNGRLTYSIWVDNLTDAVYSVYTANNAVSINDTLAKPRQVGVGLALKF